jgi:hypothetical protein
MNIEEMPLFDNHTHPMDADKVNLTPDAFALIWLHGFRDLPNGQVSPAFQHHVRNQGCVFSMVNQLSMLFGCPPTLEAVTAERNRRTAQGVKPYIDELYCDGKVNASLLDSDLPYGDKKVELFPGIVLRHIQMDPLFFKYLKECTSYVALLDEYKQCIRTMVKEQG